MFRQAAEIGGLASAGAAVSGLLGTPDAMRATPFDDLAAVHALYEARVFRFVLMSVRDRDAAMSLTQDTFLKAWKARESFRGDCAVPTWLLRIAVNLVRDHTKTERFKFWKRAEATAMEADDVALGLTQPGTSAEARMIARQKVAAIWETVRGLSEQQKTVFLLRFVEEMELAEIAAATGMHLATVKTHLHRGLEKVRSAHRDGGAGKRVQA